MALCTFICSYCGCNLGQARHHQLGNTGGPSFWSMQTLTPAAQSKVHALLFRACRCSPMQLQVPTLLCRANVGPLAHAQVAEQAAVD